MFVSCRQIFTCVGIVFSYQSYFLLCCTYVGFGIHAILCVNISPIQTSSKLIIAMTPECAVECDPKHKTMDPSSLHTTIKQQTHLSPRRQNGPRGTHHGRKSDNQQVPSAGEDRKASNDDACSAHGPEDLDSATGRDEAGPCFADSSSPSRELQSNGLRRALSRVRDNQDQATTPTAGEKRGATQSSTFGWGGEQGQQR